MVLQYDNVKSLLKFLMINPGVKYRVERAPKIVFWYDNECEYGNPFKLAYGDNEEVVLDGVIGNILRQGIERVPTEIRVDQPVIVTGDNVRGYVRFIAGPTPERAYPLYVVEVGGGLVIADKDRLIPV